MDNLYFKCSCCNNIIRMKKEVKGNFADLAYTYGVEWSDFDENVPELSEEHWERSEKTPVMNESRTLYVCKPFDESIGSEFWALFEPALVYFNGWDDSERDEIDKCAIVRCKLTKILKRNEFEAWVLVDIKKVVFLSELYKQFEPCVTEMDIEKFDGIPEKICKTQYEDNNWLVKYWDAQGDCGEYKWIYTDEKGIRHLVMQSWFDFDQSVVYIGNIIQYLNGANA